LKKIIPVLFYITLCILTCLSLSSLLGVSDKFQSALSQFVFFKVFYLEIFVILLALSNVRHFKPVVNRLIYTIAILLTSVWAIQLIILWYSDDFLTKFLLENSRSIGLIINNKLIVYSLAIIIIIAGLFIFLNNMLSKLAVENSIVNIAIAFSLLIVIFFSDNNLYKNEHKEIAEQLKIKRNSPVLALNRLFAPKPSINTIGTINEQVTELMRINSDKKNPLSNTVFYEELPNFLKKKQKQNSPNVIVFFVEAMSARKLSPYKSLFSSDSPAQLTDLTPNIQRFSEQAMTVDNYYSHTYSTFRGLRGQNCSSFPYHGGTSAWALPNFEPPEGPYRCIAHHLNDIGYETIFFGPDYIDHCRFGFQTEQIGFGRNIFREEIQENYLTKDATEPKYLLNESAHLTDHELMRGVLALLKERENSPTNTPFYIASYPKGSHVGLDSEQDGKIFADGKNRILNTTHSFDDAFGIFFRAFKKLRLSEDTIIILTADHSHWPERDYIEIAGSDYDRMTFDKIGLFIYSPFHQLPKRYDAQNTSSLGFAPMLSQLLGMDRATENSFLGHSPLDPNRAKGIGLGWASNTIFVVNKNGEHNYYDIREEEEEELIKNLWFGISLTHKAELDSKIL
jgi:phosphoglycerol transferase MdoB-like AlkP superfamily enzyme